MVWTRRALSLLVWLAALGVAAMAASPVSADEPSPKVNEYGIPVDTSGDLVTPVLLMLVLVTAGMIAAAVVAVRLRREAAALPRPTDPSAWWTCASCSALNAGDRDTCFSCRSGRPPPGLGPTPPPE